jgi:hypothetical protein
MNDGPGSVLQIMGGWLSFLGLVIVVTALISRAIAKVVRLNREDLQDPSFRRWDTSGLSRAVFWFWPGAAILATGVVLLVVGSVLEAL